jgi:flagellar hook-associated protein 1
VSFTDAGGSSLGSDSIGGFYAELVGSVATATHQAQDDATVQGALTANAQSRRQSVSAVSTDEELISVIQHQHSYQAAARLVTVVDEMSQTLIDLGR